MFFSTPISVSVCKYRNWILAGSVDNKCAASTRRCAAENSPSAWMIFDRFSRSASACLAIARNIDSGISTCLTSTLVTFTPQGAVCVIENALQPQINLVAMRQQFVEFLFAQHRAQSGLRKLRSLVGVIRDFDHRLVGIDHAQKNDRVHFERDVVARDDVLRRNLQRFLPQRNPHHAVDGGEDQNHSRTLGRDQASQPEDDAALIFGQDLDGTQQVNDEDDDDNGDHRKPEIHKNLPQLASNARNSAYERIVAHASSYRR